jgi:hypothetical protein
MHAINLKNWVEGIFIKRAMLLSKIEAAIPPGTYGFLDSIMSEVFLAVTDTRYCVTCCIGKEQRQNVGHFGFICMYVCVCVYIYIYTHTHTNVCEI